MSCLEESTVVDGPLCEGPPRTPMADEPHGELVRLAAKGIQPAWDELVRRFDSMIRRVARRSGLTDSDAADVAQATWLALLEHVHDVRSPERIPGWLATTARRESQRIAMVSARGNRHREQMAADAILAGRASADVYPVECDVDFDAVVSRLSPAYERLIRLLMSGDGLSYAEVAREMSLPLGSIGPMRARSLQMLRRAPELVHQSGARASGVK
jgi:RNA polymerase sigma factor (sigma-70 family)